MGFAGTSLILAVYITFHIYGINSELVDTKTEIGPVEIEPNSESVTTASYIIQQVTNKIPYVEQIYYFQKKGNLLFPNREINGSIYVWFQNGTTKSYYFKELSRETIATITPNSQNPNQFIIGSNQNLRLCTKNATDYTLSEPLIHFNDIGYVIYSAHCDPNGTMFILLVSTTEENEHLAKFYKIINKKAELVIGLFTKPRDFRFNENYTSMYIVHDHGRKIADVKYNIKTGDLGNATEVFDMDKYPKLKNHIMTSVVVDRNPGHLWLTAAGKEGYVLEVNPSKKTLVSITPVPNKDLTFATFGYNEYKTLFVGSKETCTKEIAQGSIYAVSGMGREGVPDNPIKWEN